MRIKLRTSYESLSLTRFHVVNKKKIEKMSNFVRKTLLSTLSTRSFLKQCGSTTVTNFTKSTLCKRTFSSMTKLPRQFGSFQQRWMHQENASKKSYDNLSKYLETEIKGEMEEGVANFDKLLEGWTKHCEGVKITLSKKVGNETVKVNFSISGALEGYSGPEEEEMDVEAPLLCKPPFEVEIVKPSGSTMAIRCLVDEYMMEEGEDDVSDRFEIVNVTIHNGKLEETTYVCEAENMDAEMYDGLLDVLEERGIDSSFVDNLVEFSTKYEKKEYVDFLTSMKKFADE